MVFLCAGVARADAAPLQCAARVFRDALYNSADEVEEDDPEHIIQQWVFQTFQNLEVNRQVLACIAPLNLSDDEVVHFPPVGYRFPPFFEGDTDAREIIVNYSVQKRMIRQRTQLAERRELPVGAPSELVGGDPNVEWANTDPAWYAIMVVQADSMLPFAGVDEDGRARYNTISLRYIADNLARFYPTNHNDAAWGNLGGLLAVPMCTSKSALANDMDLVNMAARRTTGETADGARDVNILGLAFRGNDYYVAGDVNLQWITWAQVAGDVALTVFTAGIGTKISLWFKGIRAGNSGRHLHKAVKTMKTIDAVTDANAAARAASAATDAARAADNAVTSARTAYMNAARGGDVDAITSAAANYENAVRAATEARNAANVANATANTARAAAHTASAANPIHQFRRTNIEITRLNRRITAINNYDDALRVANRADEAVAAARRAGRNPEYIGRLMQQQDQAHVALNRARSAVNVADTTTDSATAIRNLQGQLTEANRVKTELLRNTEVAQFAEASNALAEVARLQRGMRAYRVMRPQTGNVIARGYRASKAYWTTYRAARGGGRNLNRLGRAARRAGSQSGVAGTTRNYLFQATALAGHMAGHGATNLAFLYGALRFLGNVYDWSVTEVSGFTSTLMFKPLLLLSADDIKGQENIVNHGMWLMWAGDSTNPADDDAAFLQAMDFAAKFHQDLEETQDDYMGNNAGRIAQAAAILGIAGPALTAGVVVSNAVGRAGAPAGFCDVDIYVVRPIIRNPGTENQELYYLIMNDEPWRVRSQ